MKGFDMKKLMMVLMATLAATLSLIAEETYTDVQSEWYSSVSRKREATSVSIGNEYWNASNKDQPLPYRFSCGAVLRSTLGGKRLDLSNVVISGRINADGNLAILLAGNNVVSDGIVLSYMASSYPLLVFGPGSLTVRGGYPGAISSSELSICAGASVTVYDTSGGGWAPVSGSRLSVNMSSLAVFAPEGSGISSKNINILGSAVSVYAKTSGLGAYESTVVIDGSVVNVFAHASSSYSDYHKMISCTHSYLSWAKVGSSALQAGQAYFSNSLVKLYSKTERGASVGDVSFGEGDYYIASGSSYSAISVNNMTIDGGNVQVCASGENALGVDATNFKIDSGRMEMVDEIDIREFLKFDGAAAAIFTGAVAGGVIDASALMANFYSQVIADAITNGKIGNLEGNAYAGIQCDTYTQNSGTVWCDLPTYGILTYASPIINGGSCNGQFFKSSYININQSGPNVIAPTHVEVDGTKLPLKCVSYAMSGASKYDKITQSWDGILPSYYGTGSLYADEDGKLYFWVPETWNGVSGGGSGGGGSSGGSGGGGSGGGSGGEGSGGGTLPDLSPYAPSGWSAPLVVSTSSNSTVGAVSFLNSDSLYANWTVGCDNADVTQAFYARLYVDDELKHTWSIDGIHKDHYVKVIGNSLGTLSAGMHKVRIVTDATDVVAESDESNNSFETTITVVRDWFPDLSVSSLSVSRTSFTVSDSVTVHWWVESNGDAATDKSKIAFKTYKYDEALDEYNLFKTEWLDCLPLAAGGRQEFAKTINGKSLGAGDFLFVVEVDGKGSIIERNEADNLKATKVTVVKDAATSSKSSVDWQFTKKDKEADSFFLCASSDLKKKATTFNVGQTIYMRCCFWNAKKNSVYGKMRCSIYLNGVERLYGDVDTIEKNYYKYFTDTKHGFLQNRPAGSYTLTAVLDSENAWQETNEKNNVKTISFTVVGNPTIASESTYYCALNVPVSWPVTIYGKATVKGLPSGLKYSGGVISGKATKAGTYNVTFSANNAAGSSSKTIKIVVENPGFAVTCSANPNGVSSPSEVESGDTIVLFVGVKQEFSLSAEPGKAGVVQSAVSSISAKGLPSGLKLSNGVISGVPTKAGSYSATITFKNKYGWTSSFAMKFLVYALPVWASGTFEGGCGTGWDDGARVSFTVSSAGKLSGKVFRQGETWTMAASACSTYDDWDETFAFDVVLKNGKNTMDASLLVWKFADDDVGAACLSVDSWDAGLDDGIYASRTAWATGICAEALTRSNANGKSFTLDGTSLDSLASGESIKLAFGKNGSVKASANLVAGVKNGKVVFKAKSASVTLAPWRTTSTDSNGIKLTGAKLFLYFPPSGKNSTDGRFFNVDVDLADGTLDFH